ncbi:MAG: hypothetical protein AAFX05_07490 [Planctomycetota bacterium]
MDATRKPRIPQLKHTEVRGIGWHVSFRDPETGTPRKHRFAASTRTEAERLYHRWLGQHLSGEATPRRGRAKRIEAKPVGGPLVTVEAEQLQAGSLVSVASDLLALEHARVRQEGEGRRMGTISPRVYADRVKHLKDFLAYLNDLHGTGAVGRMHVADLAMSDVEGYNQAIAEAGYSASQVAKRMHIVKRLIDRAGRPEHGQQVLPWNWDSRDVAHGKVSKPRTLPTVDQLQALLAASELRERCLIWTAIGLGFGQKDLATLRVGQIDDETYDLRRGKTGVERYGETPPLVWAYIAAYLNATPRQPGELMFTTRTGRPLVHGPIDSVQQWWIKLRARIGETKQTLGGFYTLRHLGATEFGSRPGCSISSMKRWLGHAASSSIADVYMKPVTPESKAVVGWVRKKLASAE